MFRIFSDNLKATATPANGSLFVENNNLYTTSTPNNKLVNGNANDDDSINATINGNDDSSPMRNFIKEQYMNSVNANTTDNDVTTTTIIAEIEGEVKKRVRPQLDKTYYIAKEILMTELTYKKDLEVINSVSSLL